VKTAKYYKPTVESLEDRCLLAFLLTPGSNVNISQMVGAQAEGTIALDPTGNRSNLFSASVSFDTRAGLFAGFSQDGGGSWTQRVMATGGPDGTTAGEWPRGLASCGVGRSPGDI
jgi:hypothetical protein